MNIISEKPKSEVPLSEIRRGTICKIANRAYYMVIEQNPCANDTIAVNLFSGAIEKMSSKINVEPCPDARYVYDETRIRDTHAGDVCIIRFKRGTNAAHDFVCDKQYVMRVSQDGENDKTKIPVVDINTGERFDLNPLTNVEKCDSIALYPYGPYGRDQKDSDADA